MSPELQSARLASSGLSLARHDSHAAERRILNSWKEIASYLGRGVRTVQRWEAQLELPVHRPAGKEHSAVVAFSPELDEWLNSRPVRSGSAKATHVFEAVIPADLQQLEIKIDNILVNIEVLTSRVDEISRQLNTILQKSSYAPEKPKIKLGNRPEAGAA